MIVKSNFSRYCVRRRNPMQGRLHFTSVRRRIAAARRRIVCAAQLNEFTCGVLHCLATSYEIGIAKPNFSARRKSIELFGWILHKVVPLDIELSTKTDPPYASVQILGVIEGVQLFGGLLGVVLDDNL